MAGTLTAIEQYRGVTKVILVGDATVGKSAFLHSYRTNHFPDCESDMPAVVEQFSDIVIDEHGEEMAALLTDTSGNQNARVLRPLAYQGAHCVLLCFALDNPKSLKNLREYWEAEVHGALGADWLKVPKTIVGMKNDLRYEMTPEGSLWLGDDNEPVLKADQSGLVSEVDVYVQFPELDSNANGYLGYTECSAKTQLGMVGMMRRVLIPAQEYQSQSKGGDRKRNITCLFCTAGFIVALVMFINWHTSL